MSAENMPGVEVVIQDDADGRCWNIIGEVKTYAQDKPRELGNSIYSSDDGAEDGRQMDFDILVNSGRGSDGTCYGAVSIRLLAPAELVYSEGSAFAILGEQGYTFVKRENANALVLDVIKLLTDEMIPEALAASVSPSLGLDLWLSGYRMLWWPNPVLVQPLKDRTPIILQRRSAAIFACALKLAFEVKGNCSGPFVHEQIFYFCSHASQRKNNEELPHIVLQISLNLVKILLSLSDA